MRPGLAWLGQARLGLAGEAAMKLTSVVITMEAPDERDPDFGLPPKICSSLSTTKGDIQKRPERRTEGDANGCQKED
jgi:hypothetical protein